MTSSGRAYVQIRPGQSTPIRTICRHCDLNQPSPRWHTALHQARQHNLEHHGTP